jgi:hypothetical protein
MGQRWNGPKWDWGMRGNGHETERRDTLPLAHHPWRFVRPAPSAAADGDSRRLLRARRLTRRLFVGKGRRRIRVGVGVVGAAPLEAAERTDGGMQPGRAALRRVALRRVATGRAVSQHGAQSVAERASRHIWLQHAASHLQPDAPMGDTRRRRVANAVGTTFPRRRFATAASRRYSEVQSRRRCGGGWQSPGADVAAGERSARADVASG